MKPKSNNKYYKKFRSLSTYSKKQLRTRVKKNFMRPKEFLGIYNLFVNAKTLDDFIFIINMIESSKVYRHYKKCNIVFYGKYSYRYIMSQPNNKSIEALFNLIKNIDAKDTYILRLILSSILEWLFSHTIHTSSLNSVTFK